MVVNTAKTELIAFNISKPPHLTININGNTIKSMQSLKMLGVTIDSQLNFSKHVLNIENTIKSKLHAFRKIRPYYSTKELMTFAHGQIYSTLYYSSGAWLTPSLQKSLIAKLTTISNTALRTIFGTKRDELNTLQLHTKSGILSPWQQAHYGPIKLIHSTCRNNLPEVLLQEIYKSLSKHIRTNTWTLKMTNKTDIGRIRTPNSAREIIEHLPQNFTEMEDTTFNRTIKNNIKLNIPIKP